MARKKEDLTLQEKLDNALVADWEQPYSVPENWVWTRLGDVVSFIGGGTPSKNNNTYWDGTIPWASVKDIKGQYLYCTEDYITELGVSSSSTNICPADGLIIITRIEPGKPIITCIETAINQDLKIVQSHLTNIFLYYYFVNTQHTVIMKSSGSTVQGITLSNLNSIEFPLPPLAEQKRIVNRIESLFAKLDSAKELAQNALDTFENRKSAILHKAFTGELTKKWREENGVGFDSWEKKTLNQIAKITSGGTPSRNNSEYYTGNIPWLKTGEVNWNYLYDSEEKITDEAVLNSSAKIFPIGTVLVAMYGMGVTRGRASILQIEATTNQAVCALIPYNEVKNHFLFYYFMNNYEKFRKASVGGNQLNLSGKIISQFKINLPSPLEQTEIVRILDSLFEKETQAKELTNVIEKITLMKKAILARAFRGELGTNAPEEESAKELLIRILEEN